MLVAVLRLCSGSPEWSVPLYSVAFNPNMKQLVTGSMDSTLMVWNFKPQVCAGLDKAWVRPGIAGSCGVLVAPDAKLPLCGPSWSCPIGRLFSYREPYCLWKSGSYGPSVGAECQGTFMSIGEVVMNLGEKKS